MESTTKATGRAQAGPSQRTPFPKPQTRLDDSQAGVIREVALDHILVKPQIRRHLNPGFAKESVTELAESIRRIGLQQPVLLRPTEPPNRFELIAGERRLRAVQLLGRATIAAQIREVDRATAESIQRAENTLRVGLERLEEAEAVQRDYKRLGRIESVAVLWGKSRSWVHEALTYAGALETSTIAQEALESGVTADISAVNKLASIERRAPKVARATLDRLKAANGQLNVREALDQVSRDLRAARDAGPGRREHDWLGAEPGDTDADEGPRDTATVLASVFTQQFGQDIDPDVLLTQMPPQERHCIVQVLAKAYAEGSANRTNFARLLVQKGRRGEISDDDGRLYRIVAFLEGVQAGDRSASHLLRQAARARSG